MTDNYIRNVTVVGAGGHTGRFIAEALIANGKHQVTALTRPDSSSSLSAGLHAVKKVDYADHESLVQGLADQDALITMSVMAPKESQTQLIDAAVEAGVRYVVPNEWVVDMEKIEVSQQVLCVTESCRSENTLRGQEPERLIGLEFVQESFTSLALLHLSASGWTSKPRP